jgi:predicted AAA+ superfamily ATPase
MEFDYKNNNHFVVNYLQYYVYLSVKSTKMIIRILEDLIQSRLFSGKTILLPGPRQAGKTTLMRSASYRR